MSQSKALQSMEDLIRQRTAKICVVGLGYVGLPLALAFDEAGYPVYGFDTNDRKVRTLDDGYDPTDEVGDTTVTACDIEFSPNPSVIGNADVVIVAVPTPLNDAKQPNLDFVEEAGQMIGVYLREGTTVVLESTVYPGATRELFVPAIEHASGMTAGEAFGVGYSPERVVPGEGGKDLSEAVKIVSAMTTETREQLARLYESVVDVGVHPAPSLEVAEAAKCIENTQRDINIALVNEVAIACERIGVDTQDVLTAAGTKWNFHEYEPGLVGGHCIPVDPFFFIYESEQNGFSPQLVQTAREVNEYVPTHVADLTIKGLNDAGKVLKNSNVLILGLAYKPNVGDMRSSAVEGVIAKLREYGMTIDAYDPHVDPLEAEEHCGITVHEEPAFDGYDALVVATGHDAFAGMNLELVIERMNEHPVLVDVDGIYDERFPEDVVYIRL